METEDIVNEIRNSKKYCAVDKDVIERLCDVACKKYKKKKEIVKEIKNQLHIIHESFLTNNCHTIARNMIEKYDGENMVTDKDFSRELMKLHMSTQERISTLDIYEFLSKYIDNSSIVADIGCGFNPFAIPFYKNAPATYFAYDINNDAVSLLNIYFEKILCPTYRASTLDAVQSSPKISVDVVFLFKLLPLLQQQKKNRPFELIKELDFKKAIISFPIKTLSGKERGMENFYSAYFEGESIKNNISIIEKNIIGNELFYVIEKNI